MVLPTREALLKLTIKQLRELAQEHHVDLGSLTLKSDILNAILTQCYPGAPLVSVDQPTVVTSSVTPATAPPTVGISTTAAAVAVGMAAVSSVAATAAPVVSAATATVLLL